MGLFGTSNGPFDQSLDKATDECNTEEDWGLIMTICDKIKTLDDGPSIFVKAIMKKITQKVPRVSIQALTVLDCAVNNCGIEFKKEVASQDFISQLRNVLSGPPHPQVAEKIKMLIRKWADDFKDDPQLSRLTSFYHFMRSEGMEFPTEDELNPKKTAAPVSKDPNVVSSQQEADDIAKAIEMSLKDENQKKSLSSSLGTSNSATSSLYPSMLGGSASTSTNQSTSYTSGTSGASKKTVKALYDFEAAEDNELTFKAGDLISILDDSDANWWKGENAKGQGLFPANFVTTDLTVEPEPDFGIGKPEYTAEEEPEGRTVSFNDEVEVKEVDLTEPVLEIDEGLMDKTLIELQNTDPESGTQDTQELAQNEESCTQMGPLIDQKLEEIDRKHLEYTQLNEKILEALNMYDKLMNEMPVYNSPRMPASSYLKNPMNLYGQQMVQGPHHGLPAAGNTPVYSHPQQMQPVGVNASGSNPQIQAAGMTNTYNMYQQVGHPAGSYQAHNGMVRQPHPGANPQMHAMNLQHPPPSSYPQQVYSDSAVNTAMQTNQASYSNQPTAAQQPQYVQGNFTQTGQVPPHPGQQQYNSSMASMQPLM